MGAIAAAADHGDNDAEQDERKQERAGGQHARTTPGRAREAAREMSRRKVVASRKARTRIAPLTATSTVQDITAITRGRRRKGEDALSNERVDQALRVLGSATS